ncbi:sialidase family protein [Jiangella asiatica]|uniref:exo-alpha-sialidase n=1 Tax=Jiangella asiatica TaxID=2530372 RepID=A0A4R5D5L6_9ACTN|nr:sialidase family protein [Jiangella asiatica]TDE08636.1 hypothetical protein E1269_17100 [Jiangella asiatica]
MSTTTRRRTRLSITAGLAGFALAASIGASGAGWAPAPAQATPDRAIEMSTVFSRGEDGYHSFRIPAVVQAVDGTLLAFAEGRVNSASDDGDIDMVLKRSTDGGRTWGALQVVWDAGANKVGNPVPVVDQSTGRVVLNVTRAGGDVSGNDIQCGVADEEQTRRPFVLHSDDDGATWSEPVDITADVKPADWRHMVGGPGHGIQLTEGEHAGRLVIPGNHSVAPPEGSGRDCSTGVDAGGHSLYSDDGGTTWQLGAIDQPGGAGGLVPNETSVVELADGGVYFSSRDQGTSPGQRLDTVSSDGGASFDQPYAPVDGVVTSKVQGSLLRLPAQRGAADRILLAVPGHATARENLTLWSSFDSGASWSRGAQVYEGPSGYSDLVDLGGRPGQRDVGVLFENGERVYDERELAYHHRISFAVVPERLLDRPAGDPSTTPDRSGHDHDGAVSWSPGTVPGVFGRALELAGDYVELPHQEELAFGTGEFTAAAWFRSEREFDQAVMWAHNGDGLWWIRLEPGAGRIRALLDDGTIARYVSVPGDFADGEWHHVALTRDDTGVTLYLDGAASTAAPVAGSVSAAARTGIRLGARVDGINNPLVGAMDEAWLFGRALTADEVRALAVENVATDPLLHLPLNQVVG